MAVKLRVTKNTLLGKLVSTRWRRFLLGSFVFLTVTGGSIFYFYYSYYAEIIQARLEAGPFADMTVLYAKPRSVTVGEPITPVEIAAYLRRAGYSEDSNRSPVGWYHLRSGAIEINPGPESYDSEGAVIKVSEGAVAEIVSQHDHRMRTRFLLEPEPISSLYDKERQKRRIVRFEDIPQVMVDAATSAEDKNFFGHPGFDWTGILRAVYRNLAQGKREGASTITQQLARTLWLDQEERGWRRKIPEALITLHLERQLTKQQIFEYYANSIDIGYQSTFGVRGFAQGARAYFGKDLSEITLPEAALLAGLPRAPSSYDPFRNPKQAASRRNIVLGAMLRNEKITQKQHDAAVAAPLNVKRESAEVSEAPYFVDLVMRELQVRFPNREFRGAAYRIYTTLDMDLQHDLEKGMLQIKETDEQWLKRNKKYGTKEFPRANAAGVAIDSETGDLLAVSGGRSYGESQLNRALAKRQPGSSFKPFVYATGLATGLDPASVNVLTPASVVNDELTTFWFDEKPYDPHDHGEPLGLITLRTALAKSQNIPAVKVAEQVGYDKVAETARAVGLNTGIKATPAIALGAYEVTPLEIARAYTVFMNDGQLLTTNLVRGIRSRTGEWIYRSKVEKTDAIDSRVAYLTLSMMQEVMRSGTGAGARSRYGFNLPAAGKTGTSRDGWFVGFTSKIVTAVWVGFDDNRDFMLEGARSALPIWADFMKRAHEHREYANVHNFPAPDGIVTVEIDADTGELATAACPRTRSEVFIAGTQPVNFCRTHSSGGQTLVSSWDPDQPPASADTASRQPSRATPRTKASKVIPIAPASKQEPREEERKGFFERLLDGFGK